MPDTPFTNRDVLLFINEHGRVDYAQLEERFGSGMKLQNKKRSLRKSGLIVFRDGAWELTPAGKRRI